MSIQVGDECVIDASKIKTIKDIKLILGRIRMAYTPKNEEDLKTMKHLLKKEE